MIWTNAIDEKELQKAAKRMLKKENDDILDSLGIQLSTSPYIPEGMAIVYDDNATTTGSTDFIYTDSITADSDMFRVTIPWEDVKVSYGYKDPIQEVADLIIDLFMSR